MNKLQRNILIGNVDDFRNRVFGSKTIELKGIVRYDPDRTGLKKNTSCCVIEVDSGVSDFYRSQVNKHYGIDLVKPSWGTHISVVQGDIDKENILFEKYWGKYEGLEITFQYYVFPRYSGDTKSYSSGDNGWFWFLDVKCDFITKIRKELGLELNFRPHLTIGRKW